MKAGGAPGGGEDPAGLQTRTVPGRRRDAREAVSGRSAVPREEEGTAVFAMQTPREEEGCLREERCGDIREEEDAAAKFQTYLGRRRRQPEL
ncbi:hypothetical protein P1J78_03220 [Psychromarinibacter sp. C21-152]|uniref:Uncharacterized protein n=1 Tax=Psychromarinibacter sediminicola TaxID=3033385 RepID=A0AAE3T6W2_9RHOB|nr:hypothetical protein [Psychromarinibacter sediminicola]MDF0599735.1 hypothetical protein [Psychromarinibacter sediminicola]